MDARKKKKALIIFGIILAVLYVGIVLTKAPNESHFTIKEVMRDQVLHDLHRVNLFGIREVNPGLISAFTVTGVILIFSLVVRFILLPRFTMVPGRFQLILEQMVNLFSGMVSSKDRKYSFLQAYIFAVGVYVFTGTLFELFGIQVITTTGHPITLSAPLSDINGAIMMGVLSYFVIMSGAIMGNGARGITQTLNEYSLPLSMSFRLFGALLSGALVTELVYYYSTLSFIIPVFVGVMFTLLHAVMQAYVLTMLTSLFYEEAVEHKPKKKKPKGEKKPIAGAEK